MTRRWRFFAYTAARLPQWWAICLDRRQMVDVPAQTIAFGGSAIKTREFDRTRYKPTSDVNVASEAKWEPLRRPIDNFSACDQHSSTRYLFKKMSNRQSLQLRKRPASHRRRKELGPRVFGIRGRLRLSRASATISFSEFWMPVRDIGGIR